MCVCVRVVCSGHRHTCEGHTARRPLAKRTDGSGRARERVTNRVGLTNSHGKQVDK